jgi:hypothetical protein
MASILLLAMASLLLLAMASLLLLAMAYLLLLLAMASLLVLTMTSLVEYHFITRALVCRSATANHLCEELYGLQCIQTLLQD